MRLLAAALLLTVAGSSIAAEDKLVAIDTRPRVSISLYTMKRPGAPATVVLLPGGGGGIGLKGGVPTSQNFLVRAREYFAADGLNVAVVSRPANRELDFDFRVSPEHVHDLRQVVQYVKADTGVPVWLVGTSRGTISAAAGAIAFGEELAGVVLTSSVTRSDRTGAVPTQRLDAIRIPVLVLHHEKDACQICRPGDVRLIINALKNAPVKKQVMVNSGANPRGDPCEALHWHGFIGMEKEAVDMIADWVKNPQP